MRLNQLRTIDVWRSELQRLPDHQGILILSNVDGLAIDLCRQLLGSLQQLVEVGKLTVALSGESSLINVAEGPATEFNCCHQFVLQAHDRSEFARFLIKRMRIHGFNWDKADGSNGRTVKRTMAEIRAMLTRFYQLTGGDVVLLRAALLCMSERRVYHLNRSKPPSPMPDPPEDLMTEQLIPTGGLVPFRFLSRSVETAPESWSLLSALLAGRQVPVEDEAPNALELAGLIRRSSGLDQVGTTSFEPEYWKWSSLYAERFAKRHYDAKRMGDHFGAEGLWDQAFECYAQLQPEQRQRPLSNEDSIWVRHVLAAAETEFHVRSTHATWREELRWFLRQAAKQLLGFHAVAFFDAVGETWEPAKDASSDRIGKTPGLAAGAALNDEHAEIQVSAGGATVYCNGANFTRDTPSLQEAVILDPMPNRAIATGRHRYIRDLLEIYKAAWEHGRLEELQRLSRARRQPILQLSTELQEHVGSSAWGAEKMLSLTATRMAETKSMGIQRVVTLLPQNRGELLRWSVVNDSHGRLAEKSSIEFLPPAKSFLRKRKPSGWSTAKAPAWLANLPGLVCGGGVVVVPVRRRAKSDCAQDEDTDEPVSALLLIELAAHDINPDLLETLEIFSDRLHAVLGTSRNYSLLLQILNPSRNATILLDENGLIRFASNGAFHVLTGGYSNQPTGWHVAPMSPADLGCNEEIQEHLKLMLSIRSRTCRYVVDLLVAGRKGAWLADVFPLNEWNGKSAGVAVVYRDRSFLFGYFKVLRRISEATSVEGALQAFMSGLQEYPDFSANEKAGLNIRLYKLVDGNLQGAYCVGMSLEHSDSFKRGGFPMRREDSAGIAYRAIDAEQPMVFRWQTNGPPGIDHTPHGVRFERINEKPIYSETFGRKEGDFWIDVPLFLNGTWKITIALKSAVGDNLQPETLELFKFFGFALNDCLERLSREEELIRSTTETLATTAHGLVNSFASLAPMAGQIEQLPGGEKIGAEMRDFVDEELISLKRIRNRYSAIELRSVPGDLGEIVENAMNRWAGPKGKTWDWVDGVRPRLVNRWDPQLAGDIIRELAVNAHVWARPNIPLKMIAIGRILRGCVILEIADNGPGIRPEHKHAIFEKMKSIRPETMERSTGWGLYHVKRITDQRKGRVKEIGVFGEGARFRFVLPLLPDAPTSNL